MKTYNGTTVKVIGVGGIGCNTIGYIHEHKLKHVQLVACDFQGPVSDNAITDTLYLKGNEQEAYLTNVDAEIIQNTVLTKAERVKAMLVEGNPEIVFIVAGMGGATGSGAAPDIARMAKELGLLTIGVVTAPADSIIAEAGVTAMKQHTDTTIVLSMDKLNQQKESSLRIDVSDQLNKYVATAVRAITEIVTVTAEVNVDVLDVRTVMAGYAVWDLQMNKVIAERGIGESENLGESGTAKDYMVHKTLTEKQWVKVLDLNTAKQHFLTTIDWH